MTCKKLIVMVVLLSAILGVDAKRSPRKTEKLYRKAGKWQRKLRDVWALLGVKPFLVGLQKETDYVLKSKVEEDWMLKTAVEADYVTKSAAEACHDCDGVPNGPNKGDCSGDCCRGDCCALYTPRDGADPDFTLTPVWDGFGICVLHGCWLYFWSDINGI